MNYSDEYFLNEAYKQAKIAYKKDEVPVGAIIVKNNKIIAKAYNQKENKQDATAHAEILALKKAYKKLKSWHLENCIIYITLEPCLMCASAILQSRIAKVVYGSLNIKEGALDSKFKIYDEKGLNHYPVKKYIDDKNCSKILVDYFKGKRSKSDGI